MIGLTEKQSRLLAFLDRYIAEHGGVAPTFSEIENELDVRSRSQIWQMMKCLEQRGAIRRIKGHARAIEVVSAVNPAQTKADIALDVLLAIEKAFETGRPDRDAVYATILGAMR